MECGIEYGIENGTHLAYHKQVNYMTKHINYPLLLPEMG